ncbi:MAG: VRR-NUC domain-containing protein [Schwartzia sp.]|nr:VRR-NUC domain-containing protein [Schwartzia sp. (in: firmicutes)]
MREREIEKKLVIETKARGGMAAKFTSPGMNGMPDRLVLMPGGRMGFVELKAPGKKPRLVQELRMRQLRRLGFKAYVIDGTEQIDYVLRRIGGGDAL